MGISAAQARPCLPRAEAVLGRGAPEELLGDFALVAGEAGGEVFDQRRLACSSVQAASNFRHTASSRPGSPVRSARALATWISSRK